MTAEATALPMTYAEYCAFEREAVAKHEYFVGAVFERMSCTIEHCRLAAQLLYLVGTALKGRSCCVLSSLTRVRIEKADVDIYPDLSVVCQNPKTAALDDHALINPILIGEVSTKSPEAHDRELRASHYRQIPSLRAYLLVAQDRQRLELQVRQDDGRWVIIEAGPGERMLIEPLGVELAVDDVYRDAIAI
jgi:Uma2 family endonuclease